MDPQKICLWVRIRMEKNVDPDPSAGKFVLKRQKPRLVFKQIIYKWTLQQMDTERRI
jgi:hypothetical protein